jgi:hypothetical protein
MEEILAGFKQTSEASGYFETYEANQIKKNGENLKSLMENVK